VQLKELVNELSDGEPLGYVDDVAPSKRLDLGDLLVDPRPPGGLRPEARTRAAFPMLVVPPRLPTLVLDRAVIEHEREHAVDVLQHPTPAILVVAALTACGGLSR
jgi:hypothetical protein